MASQRKAKREEKARAAAKAPNVFASLGANYATHKYLRKHE